MPQQIDEPKKRNCCLLLFEILACILIIFIHAPLPGELGQFIEIIARFGVPLFFAIAGFYLFKDNNTDVHLLRKRLLKKIIKLAILFIISEITYFIILLIVERNNLSLVFESFTIRRLIYSILFNFPIVGGYNWFLLAQIYVYLFILIFPKLFTGKNVYLYIIASLILVEIFVWTIFFQFKISIFGIPLTHRMLYRNWLFFGLPVITLGIIFKRKQNSIRKINYLFIVNSLMISFAIMVAETFIIRKYLHSEIRCTIFNLVTVFFIFALAIKKPSLFSKSKFLNIPGNWTQFVYIFHSSIIRLVGRVFSVLKLKTHPAAPYLKPILSAVFAVLFALLLNFIIVKIKYLIKKRKSTKLT